MPSGRRAPAAPLPINEYDPLNVDNLTKSVVRELMERAPVALPIPTAFGGAGVYALFYDGPFPEYDALRSPAADRPIYVGKAVPAGGRKGGTPSGPGKTLNARLNHHAGSISAAENLDLADFRARYLVVVPTWITMAERFLIRHYQPLWNLVVDGFGNNATGNRREAQDRSRWDSLHPGREWATRLTVKHTGDGVSREVRAFISSRGPGEEPPALDEATIEKAMAEGDDDT